MHLPVDKAVDGSFFTVKSELRKVWETQTNMLGTTVTVYQKNQRNAENLVSQSRVLLEHSHQVK